MNKFAPGMLTILPLVLALLRPVDAEQEANSVPEHYPSPSLGEGYRKNDKSLEVLVSRAFGTTDTGSHLSHDFWLTRVQGGVVLADLLEPNYWFGGNIEVTGQLILGGQDNPDVAYYLGTNAGLRYHFRTGTPLAPYLTGSFGIGITDIHDADATGTFQFNQQIGGGARYFITPRHAIILEYDYWHISNGGIREPNDGVNTHIDSLGFAWLV